MKDYRTSHAEDYGHRHMVTGWVESHDSVTEVQAFYSLNGPEVDCEWNVRLPDGTIGPGPRNERHPMYFAPEIGYSVSASKIYSTEREALKVLIRKLEDEKDQIERTIQSALAKLARTEH